MLLPGLSLAKDAKKPKEQKTSGEVVAVAGDRLELKTKKGTVTVLLTGKPKIAMGDAEISLAALRNGAKVTVVGITQASGEIVAREIRLPAPAASPQQPPQSGHGGHAH
ncbi:MAG: DUF5666 domain-containing protein [Acidobacteriota bacterium]